VTSDVLRSSFRTFVSNRIFSKNINWLFLADKTIIKSCGRVNQEPICVLVVARVLNITVAQIQAIGWKTWITEIFLLLFEFFITWPYFSYRCTIDMNTDPSKITKNLACKVDFSFSQKHNFHFQRKKMICVRYFLFSHSNTKQLKMLQR